MRLEIQNMQTGEVKDVTNQVDNDTAPVLTLEQERDAFERVVSDISFRLNNFGGKFNGFFSNVNASNRWVVSVRENGKRLFYGDLDNPQIHLTIGWMNCTGLALMKRIWKRMQNQALPRNTAYANTMWEYHTLQEVIRDILYYGFPEIEGIDIPTEYASRLIHYNSSPTTAQADRAGVFLNLNPMTTIADFFNACAMYYNAEFSIDPETNYFMMRRRNAILTDTEKNLSELIIDTDDIELDLFDQYGIDYVHYYSQILEFPAPIFSELVLADTGIAQNPYVMTGGTYQYVLTYEKDGVESDPSDFVSVEVPAVNYTTRQQYWVKLTLPVFPFPNVRRRLYRSHLNDSETRYVMVAEINPDGSGNSLETTLTDNLPMNLVKMNPSSYTFLQTGRKIVASMWIRYNELTGSWDAPIYDTNGHTFPPTGTIFEVLPKLAFVDPDNPGSDKAFALYDIWNFFGQEGGVNEGYMDWVDMFKVKRRIKTMVKGTDHRLGDSFLITRPIHNMSLAGKYIVKKCTTDLIKKESKIELLSV